MVDLKSLNEAPFEYSGELRIRVFTTLMSGLVNNTIDDILTDELERALERTRLQLKKERIDAEVEIVYE